MFLYSNFYFQFLFPVVVVLIPHGTGAGSGKTGRSVDVQSEALLVDGECSGAAAHGAASPVGVSTPSDSKGHFLSGP